MKRLDEILEQLLLEGEALMLRAERQPAAADIVRIAPDLVNRYRAIGICLLLQDADTDAFFHWLIQAAVARRHQLRGLQRAGLAREPVRRASLLAGFVDAVAASQWALAGEIAALSADAWMEGEEYEDDFAWGRFLHLAARDTPDLMALRAEMVRLEHALEGGTSVRLDLCRALLSRDQSAFDAAFDALLAEHEASTTAILESDSSRAQDVCFEPNRLVLVEGLAVLRLAERLGLRTRREYPFCPGAARLATYAPFEPLAWPGTGLDA
jgi:immunity protein 49 of polymorphic toxin system